MKQATAENDESRPSIKRVKDLENCRVRTIRPLIPPWRVLEEFAVTDAVFQTVKRARREVANILHETDDRLVVIVGPCSIHDTKAAMEYGSRLKALADGLSKELLIIMRTYFEKPRTTIGWKGLINDPDLNQSFNINKGIRLARQLRTHRFE
jgi:3-deoxy-7-phosphoheptulonate synthase